MQDISIEHIPPKQGRGGRKSSPRLRQSIQQSEDFCGLEEGVNRYDLLLLVKRAGKSAGFTSKMIELLDYYMAYTQDQDWEEGAWPVVYKSITSTAMDLGVTERQIQHLEKQLFEVGALTWNDSGNHKRYGQRDPETGQILYAFGVDLTPLAYLRAELQAKLHEKQLYDQAWKETKRQISWYRRHIKSILAELYTLNEQGRGLESDLLRFELDYEAIAQRVRAGIDLQILREWLAKHKDLSETIVACLEELSEKTSSKDETHCTHYKYTNQGSFNKLNSSATPNGFQESCSRSSEDKNDPSEDEESSESEQNSLPEQSGLQHITGKQLLNVASERFRGHIPLRPGSALTLDDLIEAAYKLKKTLGISQKSWVEACEVLGRSGAMVCLLLTDQAALREENRVMKPAAYFKAMISRARVGELHLHKSVMGILRREFSDEDAANSNSVSTQKEGR